MGSAGFTYSYTIELPPSGGLGFEGFKLPASEILSVGKEQHAGVVAMLTYLLNDESGLKK